jgi:cbb3-type cytochrome oxidase subunit 3
MEYLKNWLIFYKKQILFVLIIFLIGSTSFAFGYLANREFNHSPIIIEKCATTPEVP